MKRYIAAGLALGTLFGLAACNDSPQDVMNKFDADSMRYDVDTRTGICVSVASVTVRDSSNHYQAQLSHATVPCTDAVVKLIDPAKLARLQVPLVR